MADVSEEMHSVHVRDFETIQDRDAFLDSECADRVASDVPGFYTLKQRHEVLGRLTSAIGISGNCVTLYDVGRARNRVTIEKGAPVFALDDGDPNPFVCECHPDRVLGNAPVVQTGTAYESDTPPWKLYVTLDGWVIGDEKIMVALCPECSAQTWDIVRDVPPQQTIADVSPYQ